ncbi:MAG: SPFH domain / Band 7 family protein [bacterium ADurb.Bin212]|nr:MAG: SPFH domain / Band 7 family protein [bacterium ADurb.Bin212]
MNKIIAILIIATLLTITSVGFVPIGHRGVEIRAGKVTGYIRGEGIFLKTPFIDGNRNVDIRTQKLEVEAFAASRDLQDVKSNIAVNFSINQSKVAELYQNIGRDYQDRVLAPAIQESVKSAIATFTAEELITKREEVSNKMLLTLREKVGEFGIEAKSLNIVNFEFSESFNQAIERKVTAQQDALAAENKLKQIEFEAKQEIEKAKGKAEAQKIEGEALRANPEVLRLRAIETWNGQMPTYWGGDVMPFFNIN